MGVYTTHACNCASCRKVTEREFWDIVLDGYGFDRIPKAGPIPERQEVIVRCDTCGELVSTADLDEHLCSFEGAAPC